LDTDEKAELKKNKKKFLFKTLIVLAVFIFAFAVFYLFFIEYSEFSSQRCLSSKIKITGDWAYRQKLFEVLSFIENKDCEYLSFVADNISRIESTTPGLFTVGEYRGESKATIASFMGENDYVSSIVIHEACHGYQNKKNLLYNESDCTLTMYNYLIKINASKDALDIVERTADFNPNYDFTNQDNDVFVQWKKKR